MKRILVTGAYGQLGRSLKNCKEEFPSFEFFWTDADTLDITSESTVNQIIRNLKPDYLLNCAGYTAVDKAESEPEQAYLLNGLAPGYLAKAMEKTGGTLVHISTDYVFDGLGIEPYRPDHPCQPASRYGITKLEGERNCLSFSGRSIVIRTSWLYSEFGQNFVKTMLRISAERETIRVVADQTGRPTYAGDMARALLYMLSHPAFPMAPRILHYANAGITTWHAFATEVINLAGRRCTVEAIPTSEYPTPAARPAYSVLDTALTEEVFGLQIPHWQSSLPDCIQTLLMQAG